MRVLLDMVNCGIANNGGSQSIIRMALALKDLGNDVKILSNRPIRFTWFDFDKSIIEEVAEDPQTWPHCDAIIATGCSTIWDVAAYPYLSKEKKYYWIRGFETWAQKPVDLFYGYNAGVRLVVNSEWQKRNIWNKIKKNSTIIYPGLPLDQFGDLSIVFKRKPFDEKITIGALYSPGKQSKMTQEILELVAMLNLDGMLKHINLFGDPPLDVDIINFFNTHKVSHTYLQQPNFEQKMRMMCSTDIWFAPTENDGLHIPPMEAGLCGCSLIVKGLESSGMSDYAIEGHTCFTFLTVYEAVLKINEYIRYPGIQLSHRINLNDVLRKKIGSVHANAKRWIEHIKTGF